MAWQKQWKQEEKRYSRGDFAAAWYLIPRKTTDRLAGVLTYLAASMLKSSLEKIKALGHGLGEDAMTDRRGILRRTRHKEYSITGSMRARRRLGGNGVRE